VRSLKAGHLYLESRENQEGMRSLLVDCKTEGCQSNALAGGRMFLRGKVRAVPGTGGGKGSV